MNGPLRDLIEALREELRQYGEMLARLDYHQEQIMRRAADDVLSSADAVQDQGKVVQQSRRSREVVQSRLARHLLLPEAATLAELISRIPDDYQPLVRALMDENNALLVRVQQRARQNHLLLRRSLDLMQKFLVTLFPLGQRTAYDGHGQSVARNLPACALYDAAG
jgi:FlgN protein